MSNLEEAIKLYIKGNELCIESYRLYEVGWNLPKGPEKQEIWDESRKLSNNGNKLQTEGKIIWLKELIRLFGFIPDCMKSIEDFV